MTIATRARVKPVHYATKFKASFTPDKAAPLGSPLQADVGTFVVTDTENKLSQASAAMVCAGGKLVPAWGDPGVWGPGVARVCGRAMIGRLTVVDQTSYWYFGFDTNQSGALPPSMCFWQVMDILYIPIGASGPDIGILLDGVTYDLSVILHNTGCLFLLKLATSNSYTLEYHADSVTSTPVYPAILSYNAAFSLSNPWRVRDLGGAFGSDMGLTKVNVPVPAATATVGTVYDTGTHGLFEVAPTIAAGQTAGMQVCRDATGANYLRAYHDLTNAHLEIWKAGIFSSSLINAAAAYGAGRRLIVRVLPSGANLAVRLFYNDVLIGTEQTVADAAIITNTGHTWESSSLTNSFANYVVWPATVTLPTWA